MSPVKQMPADPALAALVAKGLELEREARAHGTTIAVHVHWVSAADIACLDEVCDTSKDFGPGLAHRSDQDFSTAQIGPLIFFGPLRPGASDARTDVEAAA